MEAWWVWCGGCGVGVMGCGGWEYGGCDGWCVCGRCGVEVRGWWVRGVVWSVKCGSVVYGGVVYGGWNQCGMESYGE